MFRKISISPIFEACSEGGRKEEREKKAERKQNGLEARNVGQPGRDASLW